MRIFESRHFAIFFYFMVLDQKKTVELASQAWIEFEKKRASLAESQKDILSEVVGICRDIWLRCDKGSRGEFLLGSKDFLISQKVDLGPWREFIKNNHDDIVMIVVWVLILKIPISQVSRPLRVSDGTVRMRLGQGLKSLGELTHIFGKNFSMGTQ